LVHFRADIDLLVKNEGLYVNMRNLDKLGKENTSKNDVKWGENEQKFIKMRAF